MKFGRYLLASLACCLASTSQVHAQFPTRPMTMVVTFQAGGITDSIARLLAQKVSESLDKPIIVDNRPGAEGQIGAQYLAKAAARETIQACWPSRSSSACWN